MKESPGVAVQSMGPLVAVQSVKDYMASQRLSKNEGIYGRRGAKYGACRGSAKREGLHGVAAAEQ